MKPNRLYGLGYTVILVQVYRHMPVNQPELFVGYDKHLEQHIGAFALMMRDFNQFVFSGQALR